MLKLTMRDTIENGKYANKTVEEITKISGAIFSMIKDGYEFDDEVLAAAHISKTIRDERTDFVVNIHKDDNSSKPLPVETASVKQILAELHTLDNIAAINENSDNYSEKLEVISANNFDETND